STLGSAGAGSVTSTLPFVVVTSNSPLHLAPPVGTRTPPLVVFAEAHSLVETSTLPFVVSACTTLSKFTQCTLPLVVIALNRTPRGTCTSKLIFARCPRQLQFMGPDETPPWWHRPGVLSFAYTAQIVAPSGYSTTPLNNPPSSSPPFLVPSTRATSPEALLAPISPSRLTASSVRTA